VTQTFDFFDGWLCAMQEKNANSDAKNSVIWLKSQGNYADFAPAKPDIMKIATRICFARSSKDGS
jgi:hypothetical protein